MYGDELFEERREDLRAAARQVHDRYFTMCDSCGRYRGMLVEENGRLLCPACHAEGGRDGNRLADQKEPSRPTPAEIITREIEDMAKTLNFVFDRLERK